MLSLEVFNLHIFRILLGFYELYISEWNRRILEIDLDLQCKC